MEAENIKLRAENEQLKRDMGTVKQAREMTDRAMASARQWQDQANETRKELNAVLLLVPQELKSDEAFAQWLKEHPMDPITEENVERAVHRLRERLKAKRGPDFDVPVKDFDK